MPLMLECAVTVGVVLSTALAFAEAYNSNWQGTALGTVACLIGVVALL